MNQFSFLKLLISVCAFVIFLIILMSICSNFAYAYYFGENFYCPKILVCNKGNCILGKTTGRFRINSAPSPIKDGIYTLMAVQAYNNQKIYGRGDLAYCQYGLSSSYSIIWLNSEPNIYANGKAGLWQYEGGNIPFQQCGSQGMSLKPEDCPLVKFYMGPE